MAYALAATMELHPGSSPFQMFPVVIMSTYGSRPGDDDFGFIARVDLRGESFEGARVLQSQPNRSRLEALEDLLAQVERMVMWCETQARLRREQEEDARRNGCR